MALRDQLSRERQQYELGQYDMYKALAGLVGNGEPRFVAIANCHHIRYGMWCLGHCLVTAAALTVAATVDPLVAAWELGGDSDQCEHMFGVPGSCARCEGT